MKEADEKLLRENLRGAIAKAAAIARASSCTAHVSRDETGAFYASLIMPPLCRRREWLRVAPDGRVDDGNARKKIGTVQEIGL